MQECSKRSLHDMTASEEARSYPNGSILNILLQGEIKIVGRFLWGSNYTFLTEVNLSDETLPAVYKPSKGERPLWDFPHGTLAGREVAAFITSQALNWHLVPETVLRSHGPAGPGSLQFYVDADLDRHYFTFCEEEKNRLRPMATFDLLINNADRKGGHVLMAPDGHIWSIDHGVCFHVEDKLRTVIWDFANQIIPDKLLSDVENFLDQLRKRGELQLELTRLLSEDEVQALSRRAERILRNPRFPKPTSQWAYPWPLV